MAREIVWLDQARDDLRELLDFVASENPAAAAKYIEGIELACGRLIEFPLSGRRYNERYRCVMFRNHIVFYRYDEPEDQVLISAVVDGRRNIESVMDDR